MSYCISFTASTSGSGKSYRRGPHFLVNEFLPDYLGTHYSNFPLFPDKIADVVCSRNPNLNRQVVIDRMVLFPTDVVKKWQTRAEHPAEYFKDKDLRGAHISFDEIHYFANREDKKEWIQRWQEFIGDLRHRGVSQIEFLSQHEVKVAPFIRNEAHLQRYLFNTERTYEPFFGVLMADWYELRASYLTGEYTACVVETEEIKKRQKYEVVKVVKFAFQKFYYDLYDSYSAPQGGGRKADGTLHPFKQKTKFQLLIWFLRRNILNLAWRSLVVIFLVWLTFGGGLNMILKRFLLVFTSVVHPATPATAVESTPPSAAVTAVSPKPPGENKITEKVSPSVDTNDIAREIDRLRKELEDVEAQRDEAVAAHVITAQELDQARAEIEKYKADEAKRHEVVMVDKTGIVLRDGKTIAVGEKIEGGVWDGLSVQLVEPSRRRARLSDGSWVYLSRSH